MRVKCKIKIFVKLSDPSFLGTKKRFSGFKFWENDD